MQTIASKMPIVQTMDSGEMRGIMKKLLSMGLICLMIFGVLPLQNNRSYGAQADSQKITVHYHRFDDNYDDWNLWIWTKGVEGQQYDFTGEDSFGKKAELVLENIGSAEAVEFIVRKGEWASKDVEVDRSVALNKTNAEGILEFYLVQGAETVYSSESEIDLSPKFLKAEFIDEKTVKLTTSKPISSADLRENFSIVSASGVVIKPRAISSGGSDISQNFVVLLETGVTIGKPYATSYGDYTVLEIEPSGLYDTETFNQKFTYTGDLGAIYSKKATTFRVWAPTATSMTLNLYKAGDGGAIESSIVMDRIESGVWETIKSGDLNGKYYTFSVDLSGKITETYDPYAKAAGVNGNRSMVIDFERTNPKKWSEDRGPVYKKSNDMIVYEMHIRDLTIHDSANVKNKGKYLGVIEDNTITDTGVPTGLSHLKGLGITHVQIMPMFDFNSIDETRLSDNAFNWGYDPKNYSVPEGSYSTDPYHGEVRVNEMKRMIKGLHDNGIGVIMDVVYNHTALSADSNLTLLVPNYYYRMVDGKYSNASGTGNETASERAMVRKLMIDSLKHWVKEYHIDGFRFDLMGVHDIETMLLIDAELRKINPDIILYGEGWTGGTSTLSEDKRLVKANMMSVENIGAFNDDFRDGVKGHVFNATEAGFVGGAPGFEESVKFGIVGAVFHPQINYDLVNYSKKAWANHPSQSVNYVSAHDNLTLWDKLKATNPEASNEQRTSMQKLANAIVLTSQGMPFLHLGVDFLRTKNGDGNSYKSPDTINAINWDLKSVNSDVYQYYKGLIGIRKAYSAFRLEEQEEIVEFIEFFDENETSKIKLSQQMIGYKIDAKANKENNLNLFVLFNGSLESQQVVLPEGTYRVLANDEKADVYSTTYIDGGAYVMPGSSTLILEQSTSTIEIGVEKIANKNIITLFIIFAILIVIIGSVVLMRKINLEKKHHNKIL